MSGMPYKMWRMPLTWRCLHVTEFGLSCIFQRFSDAEKVQCEGQTQG